MKADPESVMSLSSLASCPDIGWDLADLVDACDLDNATVHRMLMCLTKESMVEQRALCCFCYAAIRTSCAVCTSI